MANVITKVFALRTLGLQTSWTLNGGPDYPGVLLPDVTKVSPDIDPNNIETNTLNAHIQCAMDPALFPIQRDEYIPSDATIASIKVFINAAPTGGGGHKVKAYINGNAYGAETAALGSGLQDVATFATDPITLLPWLRTNLATRTFGIQLTTIGGGPLFINVIAIEIVWNPVGPFFTPPSIRNDGASQVAVVQAVSFATIQLNIIGLGLFDIDTVVDNTSFICTPPAGVIGTYTLRGSWTGGGSVAPENNFGYTGSALFLPGLETVDTFDVEFSDPDYDFDIQGGLDLGDLAQTASGLIMITNGSGIYGLTPGQAFDRLYSRNSTTSDTVDVPIPNPFFETTFLGD